MWHRGVGVMQGAQRETVSNVGGLWVRVHAKEARNKGSRPPPAPRPPSSSAVATAMCVVPHPLPNHHMQLRTTTTTHDTGTLVRSTNYPIIVGSHGQFQWLKTRILSLRPLDVTFNQRTRPQQMHHTCAAADKLGAHVDQRFKVALSVEPERDIERVPVDSHQQVTWQQACPRPHTVWHHLCHPQPKATSLCVRTCECVVFVCSCVGLERRVVY
jgi:hypothetical protein